MHAAYYAQMYIVSVLIFFALDMVWLTVIAPGFYQSQLGYLLGPVKWHVAISFYALFLVGLMVFAISPALAAQSFKTALMFGALFGFMTYATYDLTNWATVRDWPALVSIVDMIWGTALSAAVSGLTYVITLKYLTVQ